jgi:glycosyltransferase involved in cell wall biosynthesis
VPLAPPEQSTYEPRVSVVLPTRDRASSLGRAIQSVLAQTYPHVELIVVDDGSQDDTAQVLAAFAGRITVLTSQGKGAYVARNLALGYCTGELVAFLDSDDAWLPNRLAAQVPLMANDRIGFVYGDAMHVRPAGDGRRTTTSFRTTAPRRGRISGHLAWGNCVPTITVLARKSCLEEIGHFAVSHQTSADYLAWVRLALRHDVDFVPYVVAAYTVHEGGISWDLGQALSSRIELFTRELTKTDDPRAQAILRRLLCCLGLGLVVAILRGKATRSTATWRLAWQQIRGVSPAEALKCVVVLCIRRASSRGHQLAGRFRDAGAPQ